MKTYMTHDGTYLGLERALKQAEAERDKAERIAAGLIAAILEEIDGMEISVEIQTFERDREVPDHLAQRKSRVVQARLGPQAAGFICKKLGERARHLAPEVMTAIEEVEARKQELRAVHAELGEAQVEIKALNEALEQPCARCAALTAPDEH